MVLLCACLAPAARADEPTPTVTETPTPTHTPPPAPAAGCDFVSAPLAARAVLSAHGGVWAASWANASCVLPLPFVAPSPEPTPLWIDVRKDVEGGTYTITTTVLAFATWQLPAGDVTRAWLVVDPSQVDDGDGWSLAGQWFAPGPGECRPEAYTAGSANTALSTCGGACSLASLASAEAAVWLELDDVAAHVGNFESAYTTLRLVIADDNTAPDSANALVLERGENAAPPELKLEICPPEHTPTPTPVQIVALFSLDQKDPKNPFPSDRALVVTTALREAGTNQPLAPAAGFTQLLDRTGLDAGQEDWREQVLAVLTAVDVDPEEAALVEIFTTRSTADQLLAIQARVRAEGDLPPDTEHVHAAADADGIAAGHGDCHAAHPSRGLRLRRQRLRRARDGGRRAACGEGGGGVSAGVRLPYRAGRDLRSGLCLREPGGPGADRVLHDSAQHGRAGRRVPAGDRRARAGRVGSGRVRQRQLALRDDGVPAGGHVRRRAAIKSQRSNLCRQPVRGRHDHGCGYPPRGDARCSTGVDD